jgi:hypothetical protein
MNPATLIPIFLPIFLICFGFVIYLISKYARNLKEIYEYINKNYPKEIKKRGLESSTLFGNYMNIFNPFNQLKTIKLLMSIMLTNEFKKDKFLTEKINSTRKLFLISMIFFIIIFLGFAGLIIYLWLNIESFS